MPLHKYLALINRRFVFCILLVKRARTRDDGESLRAIHRKHPGQPTHEFNNIQ